jgi:small subunit ribosomal protein S9
MADKKFRNITKNKKKNVLKVVKEKIAKIVSGKKDYTEALGRRKTATARVRLYPATKMEININGKSLEDFFGTEELRKKVTEALESTKEKYLVSIFVKGSGINAQAEASRLGIARALVSIDAEVRGELKEKGFLKRDPRSVERKKPGLKKARKAPT